MSFLWWRLSPPLKAGLENAILRCAPSLSSADVTLMITELVALKALDLSVEVPSALVKRSVSLDGDSLPVLLWGCVGLIFAGYI